MFFKRLPNGDVCYFLPALETRVPHRLVYQECIVMAHKSESHNACCGENVGLYELVSIRWTGSAGARKQRKTRR